jgi:xanthine dehydrogenase iron-sulfur cluster and FAD-binding subunit A
VKNAEFIIRFYESDVALESDILLVDGIEVTEMGSKMGCRERGEFRASPSYGFAHGRSYEGFNYSDFNACDYFVQISHGKEVVDVQFLASTQGQRNLINFLFFFHCRNLSSFFFCLAGHGVRGLCAVVSMSSFLLPTIYDKSKNDTNDRQRCLGYFVCGDHSHVLAQLCRHTPLCIYRG